MRPITTAATATVDDKATPSITWTTPGAITYGTALSATQSSHSRGELSSIRRLRARCRRRHAHPICHLYANRCYRLHRCNRNRDTDREQGHSVHHLANARSHHLRDSAECHPVERQLDTGGHFASTARQPERCSRRPADPICHFHADRYDRLHRGNSKRGTDGEQGHAFNHLDDAGGDYLRDCAERNPAERQLEMGGTFAYSPTSGAVPTAGTQTLSVTFTPTEPPTTPRQPPTWH